MSFNQNNETSKVYAPGYFLAHEECVRVTKEASKSSALVVTEADGTKYLPMGTAYPTNDSSAIGIVYEDVDVTTGNMPASVVTKGVVYEDRLAITGEAYNADTDITSADNPTTKGWYESDGAASPTYTLSVDTVASRDKTYYESDGGGTPTYTAVTDVEYGDNPKELGLYESDGQATPTYTLSTDTQADGSKTYYKRSDVRLSANAKSALSALGFTFVTESSVTRPY